MAGKAAPAAAPSAARPAPVQAANGGTALVLSGAGSRGAYQAGCWQALHESGFRPSLVVGTSAGALNAAMIVLDTPPHEMAKWWRSLATRDLLRLRRDVWRWRRWTGLHDAAGLRRLVEDNMDIAALRKARPPLVVTALDLEASREVAFAQEDLTVDHLVASCALMPGLPPVLVGGRPFADGGHWNAFPLRHALERGHRKVVALLHDPLAPHAEPAPDGIMAILRRASDVTWHSQQAAALDAIALRTSLPEEDPRWLPEFELDLHAPDPPLGNLILDFDRKTADELVRRGYEETRKRMGRP